MSNLLIKADRIEGMRAAEPTQAIAYIAIENGTYLNLVTDQYITKEEYNDLKGARQIKLYQ